MAPIIVTLINHEPILTSAQFDRLSNIFDNAGQVLFGALVISPFVSQIDKPYGIVVPLGIAGTIICWIVSVLLSKKEINI